MLRSLCARPSFCAFSGRRSQISLAVAYPGSRPQSTCTGSIPGLDAVIPFSLYQQLQENNEQLHEKLAREMKEMLRSQAEGRDKLSGTGMPYKLVPSDGKDTLYTLTCRSAAGKV